MNTINFTKEEKSTVATTRQLTDTITISDPIITELSVLPPNRLLAESGEELSNKEANKRSHVRNKTSRRTQRVKLNQANNKVRLHAQWIERKLVTPTKLVGESLDQPSSPDTHSSETDYTPNLADFLKEICPSFILPESFSFLKDQTISTLNLLLKLVTDLYRVSKDSLVDLGSALIHVLNFYINTNNASKWTEVSLGFASLCLSLFKLETITKSAEHVRHVVNIFLNQLGKFFIKAEGVEKDVKSFWNQCNVTNPRSLFGMVQACSGIFTSIICLRNFVTKSFREKDISELIVEISSGFFKIGSEVRNHSENISLFLARVFDWISVNAEALMKLQFDQIKWELPSDQVFESSYVEICNVMSCVVEDPLYLETNNLSLGSLRERLMKLRVSGDTEINKNPVPSVRSAIVRYLTVIDNHLRLIEARMNPDNTKPQPMSVTLVGTAGCGKSSASTKIGLMMQCIAGLTPNETLICNRGGDPKFEENISGSTDVIIFDDYANDQSKTLQTKEILDIVNTSKEVIPKASVEQKGRHKYNNIGTIITTNDRNLGVKCFKTASIESILRRLGIVIFLSIQEEFCLPGTDRLDLNHPAVSDEVFNTAVYHVTINIPAGVVDGSVIYDRIEYSRNEGNDEWRDAILHLQTMLSSTWIKNVARQERAKSSDNLCAACSLPKDMCMCTLMKKLSEKEIVAESYQDIKGQLPEYLQLTIQLFSAYVIGQVSITSKQVLEWLEDNKPLVDAAFMASGSVPPSLYTVGTYIANQEPKELRAMYIIARDLASKAKVASSIKSKEVKDLFFNRIPASASETFGLFDTAMLDFSSSLASRITLYMIYMNTLKYAKTRVNFYIDMKLTFLGLLGLMLFTLPYLATIVIIACFIWYEVSTVKAIKREATDRLLETGTFIAQYKKVRYAFYGVTFAGGALALFSVFSALMTVSKVLSSEEAVQEPTTVVDSTLSDTKESPPVSFAPIREKTSSDQLGYFQTRPRPAHTAVTMTHSQVIADIGKGIAKVVVTDDKGIARYVKSLPMGSEYLIPNHVLPATGLMDITVRASDVQGADYNHREVPQTHVRVLEKSNFLTTKKLDAALVHLPNAPPGKDFHKYLADAGTIPSSAGCSYLHKDCSTGTYVEILVRARLLKTAITYESSRGTETQYVYECSSLNHTSSDGDCGQPLIYNNAIIGIHIAGSSSGTWYCLAIDKSTVARATEMLKNESSIFVASHSAIPVLKRNLKDLYINDTPTSYVTETLGVATTPIVNIGTLLDANHNLYKPRSEDYYFRNGNHQIEAEFGERTSRPPKYVNGEKQINTTLEKLNTPKMDAPISLMDRASTDYVHGTTAKGDTLAGYATSLEKANPGFFRVRTLQEALDGDGTGIVRGMNNQTSAGLCYGGKKTKHMIYGPDNMVLVPRELNDYVQEDIESLGRSWREGQGTFDPFVRASKTNEVLPLEKAYEKTRSVYGNDMSFFLAGTMAIIPLKHVLRNQTLSECYVGLAAQSSEWTGLHDHISKGGTYTKFVCGDFSGYDTQLPKSLMEKAAAILIDLYRTNGASASDIEYVRGFLSSVVSPALVWEGNIFQMSNGQPSGQPLTVEMNSIINSILIRMAFYQIMDDCYPEIKDPNFRDYVALAVYGDDNAMGVSDEISFFNHTSIQSVFASWGIKYTMADKGADSVPYQTLEEVSFLKRQFRFHPELNTLVAPIEENSLSKKFYWWTKSKNTPLTFPEQFQANFESQAREAYLHGEEFYLEFCAKCERIVAASQEGDERFVLPWNTIQPATASEMKLMLIDSYTTETR